MFRGDLLKRRGRSGMAVSLSNLIAMICSGDFISTDMVFQRLPANYRNTMTLEGGVERFLWENELDVAIIDLVDWRAIVSMAKEVDAYCPDKPEITEAFQRLLQGLGLEPSIAERAPLGAKTILKRLQELQENLVEVERWGRVKLDDLRRLPLDGWSYIERVLKGTIIFYASFFDSDESVKRRFTWAKTRNSLGLLFDAMTEIEKKFGTETNDLTEQSLRLYGRKSPFAGFSIENYKTEVGSYRNFYAHNIPEIINNRNIIPIREALEITIRLVKELIDREIAPSVIYIVGHGQDQYGRDFLRFVEEHHVKDKRLHRENFELMMFKQNPSVYAKLKPYLTITDIRDRIFDPPLVPLKIDEQGVLLDDAV
jgi:hypothetical protein